MKTSTSIKRIITSTAKQIKRSGWLSWASVMVIALAFFIASVFIAVAYTSNLFLQSIENEPHIYVFFKVGTEEEEINRLKTTWEQMKQIERIEYTSEEQAVEEFKNVQDRTNPQISDSIKTNILPASLGIRLNKIQDADQIVEMTTLEQDVNENIFAVRFNKQTIDTIKSLFYWLRIAGGVMMSLLLIVIFTFTLLTVEFRTFSRAEEIGIMQLVGGSLWFIRSPFVVEGGFYGFMGSLISSITVYTLSYLIFIQNSNSGAVTFLINFFGDLKWPVFGVLHYVGIFLIMVLTGSLIGAFNSYIAIKRYIN